MRKSTLDFYSVSRDSYIYNEIKLNHLLVLLEIFLVGC